MDGLTNIIAKIHEQTDTECQSILASANEKAKAILDKAKAEAEEAVSKIESMSEAEIKVLNSRAVSTADAEYKRALLSQKSVLLDKAVSHAIEKIKNSPADVYFGYIKKLVLSSAAPGKGTLKMSQRDLERMPSDFVSEINKELSGEKSVELSRDASCFDGGFVIEYPEIRVDCTFSSLVDDKIDEMRDELSRVLFS